MAKKVAENDVREVVLARKAACPARDLEAQDNEESPQSGKTEPVREGEQHGAHLAHAGRVDW